MSILIGQRFALILVLIELSVSLNLLAIVAREVIVSHGKSVVVILGKLLSFAQQLMRLLVAPVTHVLDRQHVADVADLDANLRKLGTQSQ